MIAYPNINPVALDLGFVSIYWYGISYVVGILGAWVLLRYRVRHFQLSLDNEQIADLVFFAELHRRAAKICMQWLVLHPPLP